MINTSRRTLEIQAHSISDDAKQHQHVPNVCMTNKCCSNPKEGATHTTEHWLSPQGVRGCDISRIPSPYSLQLGLGLPAKVRHIFPVYSPKKTHITLTREPTQRQYGHPQPGVCPRMPLGLISQVSWSLVNTCSTLTWSQVPPQEQKENPFPKPKVLLLSLWQGGSCGGGCVQVEGCGRALASSSGVTE